MSKEIRFKGIVATLAQIAADAFAGRISWASDLARPVHYYTDSDYAVLARKDVAETFPGVKITNQAGPVARMVQAGTDGTQSAVSAATARATLSACRNTIYYDHRSITDYAVSGSTEQTIRTITITKAQLVERGDVYIRFTGMMKSVNTATGPTSLRVKINGVTAYTKTIVNNGTTQNIAVDIESIIYRADVSSSPDLYAHIKDLSNGSTGGFGGTYTDPDTITVTITGQGSVSSDMVGVYYCSAK